MNTTITLDTTTLDTITLAKGAHPSRQKGVCLLEAAAWIAGEPHSDHPNCVCPVLARFGRGLNDVLPDDLRQQLKPLIPKMLNTADDGNAQRRGLMAADWIIRTYTSAWVRLQGDTEMADRLAAVASIESWDDMKSCTPLLKEAQKKMAAAGDAAGDAAWDAAGGAARDAAWDAAWAAAWAAAWDAAWDAAGGAARDAARAAAWAAAWDAAWAAAWDAAKKKLQPTVEGLHHSAIALMQRMCELPRNTA